MFVPRVPADYGHVVIAEIQGREPRGTVERMIEAASGLKRAAEADVGVAAGALLKLAESLKAPDLVRKQINELASAAAASKAAADGVKAEQAKLDRSRQELDAERSAQATAIAKELQEHRAFLEKERAEIAVERQQADNALAKVKTDAADVAKQKARLAEKLRLIESAA